MPCFFFQDCLLADTFGFSNNGWHLHLGNK